MNYKNCRIMITLENDNHQQTYGEVDITQEVNEAINIDRLMDDRGVIIKAMTIMAFERAQGEMDKL